MQEYTYFYFRKEIKYIEKNIAMNEIGTMYILLLSNYNSTKYSDFSNCIIFVRNYCFLTITIILESKETKNYF